MKCVHALSLFVVIFALGTVGCSSRASSPNRTVNFSDYRRSPNVANAGTYGADRSGSAMPRASLRGAGTSDAGIYFDDGSGGAYRARTENIFPDELGSRAGETSGLGTSDFTTLQDMGVDFRGLGGQTSGSLVQLDDITNDTGAEDEARTSGPPPPPRGRKSWKRSTLVPNASRLSVGDNEYLPLEAMGAAVRIDGFRARVVLDFFFRNDKELALEGDFQLRLPNGAAPDYLAFGAMKLEAPVFIGSASMAGPDIRASRAPTWDAPKEARVVPRAKAAHTYGEIVRQSVDPALMEWAGADVFNARVFPLAPGKLHRIVVGYDVDLQRIGDALTYRLDLPSGVPQVDVDLRVSEPGARVAPQAPLKEGRYHWHNPAADSIVVQIPSTGALLLKADDAKTGGHFVTRIRPTLPETPTPAAPRALFLVDTSLSSNPDAMQIWLRLVQAVLVTNRSDLREFSVAFFNVETRLWRGGFQANTTENAAALKTFANELALEGATDLGQAIAATKTLGGAYDVFLLSDGAVTWGEGDVHALSRALPDGHALFAYATGAGGTDRTTLAHLARETGGAVFAVPNDAALDSAATAHRKRPWRLVDIRMEGAHDLLLAGRPKTLFPGQTLTLVGRGRPTRDAAVTLTVEQDGTQQTLRIPLKRHISSPLATRAYAHIAVGQLEGAGTLEHLAQSYATHYRIVGRTCSLLMLESDADYARYDIKPADNAKLVNTAFVANAVSEAHQSNGTTLGNPKMRFKRWVTSLASLDHISAKLPTEVLGALDAMPASSFEVLADTLHCRQHARSDLPAEVRDALAKRTLTYDGIHAEAERRNQTLSSADALRALSSLVEHQPGDLMLARDIAFTALSWGLSSQAYHLLRRVIERRPHETATYYALALALQEVGKTDLAMLHFEIALATGAKVKDFDLIVSFAYLRMLRRIERGELASSVPDFARTRQAEVAKRPKVRQADLVVVMAWNTDRTDVDLHVQDPNREICNYQHKDTKIGGHLTHDITTGFGPEMFVLRNAIPGEYIVDAHFFSTDAARAGARSKIYVTVYEDWGRPNERVTRKTVTLTEKGQRHRLIELTR